MSLSRVIQSMSHSLVALRDYLIQYEGGRERWEWDGGRGEDGGDIERLRKFLLDDVTAKALAVCLLVISGGALLFTLLITCHRLLDAVFRAVLIS